jgi:hypothetical protein
MKAVRKPLVDEVWYNVGKDSPDFEPMPDWVKAKAEIGAAPDTTFRLLDTVFGTRIVRPGDYVIKGPTDIYPVAPEGFAASYEEKKK